MKKEIALPLLKLVGEGEINYHIYRYILSVKEEINSFLNREINPYLADGVSISVEKDRDKIAYISVEADGVKGTADVLKTIQKTTYLLLVLAFTNCDESVLEEFWKVFQGKENHKLYKDDFLHALLEYYARTDESFQGFSPELAKNTKKLRYKVAEISVREFIKGTPRNKIFEEIWATPALWRKIGEFTSASFLRTLKNPLELDRSNFKDLVYAVLFLNSQGEKRVDEEITAYKVVVEEMVYRSYVDDVKTPHLNETLKESLPDKFAYPLKSLSLESTIKIEVSPKKTLPKETKGHKVVI